MFVNDYPVWRSTLLYGEGVGHAFSTRMGGVSREAHTRTMNTGFFRGDSDETVLENIRLLCTYAWLSDNVVGTPQIHSADIRVVTPENVGEGITRDVPYPCDGFVTEHKNVTLIVRVADCAPILLKGTREDGSHVVGAVHAGWRGAAAGIAPKCAKMLFDMGAKTVVAAIGPSIGACCYQVGEDMRDSVAALQGREFADRHVFFRDGQLYADVAGISEELMLEAGVSQIDVLKECTNCKPWLYHSHRATGGVRGTMAAVIGII